MGKTRYHGTVNGRHEEIDVNIISRNPDTAAARTDEEIFLDLAEHPAKRPDSSAAEFSSYEDFKEAVIADLDAHGFIYSLCGELPDLDKESPESIEKMKAACKLTMAALDPVPDYADAEKPGEARTARLLHEQAKQDLFEIELFERRNGRRGKA